jgi:hypothetical protein
MRFVWPAPIAVDATLAAFHDTLMVTSFAAGFSIRAMTTSGPGVAASRSM